MSMTDTLTLTRDCDAIQIPYGNMLTARAGQTVSLVHKLGDTFTVRTDQGYLLRIDGKDADALGLQHEADSATPTTHVPSGPVSIETVWDQLRTCYDPEIPANIVDLGLIYEVTVDPDNQVAVKMTLTAPGCGMGQVLKDDVERKVTGIAGVRQVLVDLVFSPPWDPTMMTEAARLQLGMM